jgi:hypothetical protein
VHQDRLQPPRGPGQVERLVVRHDLDYRLHSGVFISFSHGRHAARVRA